MWNAKICTMEIDCIHDFIGIHHFLYVGSHVFVLVYCWTRNWKWTLAFYLLVCNCDLIWLKIKQNACNSLCLFHFFPRCLLSFSQTNDDLIKGFGALGRKRAERALTTALWLAAQFSPRSVIDETVHWVCVLVFNKVMISTKKCWISTTFFFAFLQHWAQANWNWALL